MKDLNISIALNHHNFKNMLNKNVNKLISIQLEDPFKKRIIVLWMKLFLNIT